MIALYALTYVVQAGGLVVGGWAIYQLLIHERW